MDRGHALEFGRRSGRAPRDNPVATWLRRPRRRREADALLRASRGSWESHPAVAWRVAELTSPYERRRLARGVEGAVDEARDSRSHLTPSVLCRRHVRSCVPDLLAVVDLLADVERPVTGAGVVLVRDLLNDGRSPLYDGVHGRDLSAALVRIRATLEAA